MVPQLRGGITLIVHFLGAKNWDNSKGGELRNKIKRRGKSVIQNVIDVNNQMNFKVLPGK